MFPEKTIKYMINVKMSNKLLFLIFLFIIAINNSKADQGDLEKLYRAVSKELNIGTYEDFKAKMQTVDERRRFYDKVDQLGYDLGPYEVYEQRLKSVGSNQYSKRDSIKLARQAVYKDMVQESAGISYDKFIENLSKDENVRRSVYHDMGFGEENISYERFLNKMGLDYKRQLWEDLNKKGFYTKSFEEFENQFSTPDKVQTLFNKLVDGNYFKGSNLDFIERYFSDIGNSIYTFLKANNLTVKNEREFVEEYAQNADKQKILYNFFKENDLTALNEDVFFRKYCPEWTLLDDGLITKDREVNQNDLLVNVNWKIIAWIVIGLIMIVLIWYLFKTGIFRKIFDYLSDVFRKFAVWIRKNKKRIGISLAVILSIAIVTNPSVDTFKSFLRSKGYPKTKIENLSGRYANFYVFSIYKYEGETYLGFFGNFIHNSN